MLEESSDLHADSLKDLLADSLKDLLAHSLAELLKDLLKDLKNEDLDFRLPISLGVTRQLKCNKDEDRSPFAGNDLMNPGSKWLLCLWSGIYVCSLAVDFSC